MARLHQCPFCNAERSWIKIKKLEDGYRAHCKRCKSEGPVGDSKEIAKNFWNNRFGMIEMLPDVRCDECNKIMQSIHVCKNLNCQKYFK